MQATLTQPMQTIGTDSTVTYHPVNNTIAVTVVVSHEEGQPDITTLVAPVTIPTGTWTLFWNLVVDTIGLNAVFNPAKGILLTPPLPPKVTVVSQPAAVSPEQWKATFTNEVTDVNAFTYVTGIDWSFGVSALVGTTFHDPTIAVTKDPI